MKKLLIPIAVIACASIAVLCTACQQENTESEATTAPSITIIQLCRLQKRKASHREYSVQNHCQHIR